ncbi:MAG: lysophospholipid acyltransferase family protein [Candidatus Omnitrophota bacterium]|nr:MAG: lysophospholipid acyltransferase family protein [Candidatus Omnitrophota bacterium]
MDKEKRKIFRRKLGWYVIRAFTFLNGTLPLGWSYFLGGILGGAAYFVAVRHGRVALESLAIAFPDLSKREREKIAYDFFVFMAQSTLEALCFLKKSYLLSNVHIQGEENLKKALEKGEGVIIVSAHLGNFPLMSLKLAKEGYPVNVVVRPMRDQKAGDYFHDLRIASGVKTIFSYPRRKCVNGIINALRKNEIVIIQMDQNFGTGGVWVRFFGQLAATPVGPIIFALRTKAAIVPGYIFREAKGEHNIKLFEQEQLLLDEDRDRTILINAINITRIIEGWVRDFPQQWGWIHRRWKSRPSESIKNLKFKIEK